MEQCKAQIKAILESSIANLEQRKANELQTMKQKVMQEKIIPYNANVDKEFQNAVAKMAEQLNAEIAKLQAEFAKEKDNLFSLGNKNKLQNQETVMAIETSAISNIYDAYINDLKKQITKLGE